MAKETRRAQRKERGKEEWLCPGTAEVTEKAKKNEKAGRRRLERAPFFVFYEEAGIFDYEEAGGASLFRGGGMRNSLLEPERFGVDGYGGIRDRGNVVGTAEDVDDVNGPGGVFEAGIGFFAENFGFVGVDRDDFVADRLEIRGDFMGGAPGIGGEADYGDGFGGAEEIADGVESGGVVDWEMDEHFCWMWEAGKRIERIGEEWKSLEVQEFKSSKRRRKRFDTDITESRGVRGAEKPKCEERRVCSVSPP